MTSGHPRGLYILFITEMWERFSYYGMRALLVPYLVFKVIAGDSAFSGRGWNEADAMHLYGAYTGLAYLFPIVGGIIADKLIGTHRSMITGALLIAAGHTVLAVSGLGSLAFSHEGLSIFITGLALIILGTGHFKPCVSVMVGQLYADHDPRRDGGFSIFYMGINVGAFFSALVCGTLGEKLGWHYGFGAAAVGMILGLGVYLSGRSRLLQGIGNPPAGKKNYVPHFLAGSTAVATLFGLFFYIGGLQFLGHLYDISVGRLPPALLIALGLGAVLILVLWFIQKQEADFRGPVATILAFVFFNAFFWMAFEQAGSTLNLFAQNNTDRMIGDFEMPFTWFQSINPLLIVLLAPLYAILWSRLGTAGRNPTQSVKIALGLILLGAGYCFMVAAGSVAATGVKVSMVWLIATYTLHTMGELCLSPTGLSFVTKVSPAKWVSFLMGIWFLSSVVANSAGGLVAGYLREIESGRIDLTWLGHKFGGQGDFFFLFVISSVSIGLLALILTPVFRKVLHGRE